MKITIYDTTLRDGAQGQGLAFSMHDKLRIVELLDRMGVDYIEAGAPGSNPKDAEFFSRIGSLNSAKIVAFGPTCRWGVSPENDEGIKSLLDAKTQVVCVFGKAWKLHATDVLGITAEQNLEIIRTTVAYLKAQNREVFFDAEHFFDGWKDDREYALAAMRAAAEGGASRIALCDTNGGTFPHEISEAFADAQKAVSTPLGIHAHNDCGMGEANAIAAVVCGAEHVQCTLNGWGERCGNTNLFTVVPNLSLKLGLDTLPHDVMENLTVFSREFCELCNREVYPHAPYVGGAAFAHKAGMHIDAVEKTPRSFEHIEPFAVGQERRFLVSEYVGRSAVWSRAKLIVPTLRRDSPEIEKIVAEIKSREHLGYQFEGADASFELMVKRVCGLHFPHFELISFNVNIAEPSPDSEVASAVVRIKVGGIEEVAGAAGNGPVNALDRAMRKALEKFYPQLLGVRLADYRVRVLGGRDATASHVRVIIESTDGETRWATVGVSPDVVGASWLALVDSMEYFLGK